MNRKSLHIIEFDKIRELLSACTSTDGGRELALSLEPDCDIDEVRYRQTLTTEAKEILNEKGRPSLGEVRDVISAAERADKGALLSMRELLGCAATLRCARVLSGYVSANGDKKIDEIFSRLVPVRQLEDRITASILTEDTMADTASPTLTEIRREIRRTNSKIRDLLQKYVSSDSKFLQENIITTRGGRFVIPVKSEYRSEVKGLIHDTSQTGSTLFIEPMSVVEANNDLRTLQSREAQEIEKILYELSELVGENSTAVKNDYKNIVYIDFLFASAELSLKMKASPPTVTERGALRLNKARHPLLDPATVVPISVALGEEYKMLVITGPNTGGKTVTLKTVGLLSAMAQAGLHIPAECDSEVCVYDDIFAEIGDEQSIEQSLSTFSSHMKRIVDVVERMTEKSLVLFDELGSGTDPVEGAALATAILEEVRQVGASCIATTHYAELKAYAIETDGVMNASCEFDVATLRPTYRLNIGTPGKSNAFAISEKLGLPAHIVSRAHGFIDDNSRSFENIIEKLENTRAALEKEREEVQRVRTETEEYRKRSESEYESKLARAQRDAEKLTEKAQQLLTGARATSEFVFAELDRAKRAKDSEDFGSRLTETKKTVRQRMREYDDRLNPVRELEDDGYVLPRELKRGDNVVHRNLGVEGVLLDDPDKKGMVTLRIGAAKTRANVSDLRLLEGVTKAKKRESDATYRSKAANSFKAECDIRGMTGEDGCFIVDNYLEEAISAHVQSVTIIHGKGTGALRSAVWKFLKTDRRVADFRAGQYGEGDYGVTVVDLKK